MKGMNNLDVFLLLRVTVFGTAGGYMLWLLVKTIYNWGRFRRHGVMTTACVAGVRKKQSGCVLELAFADAWGRPCTTSMNFTSSGTAMEGLSLQITYDKEKSSRCILGDGRRFPGPMAAVFAGLLLLFASLLFWTALGGVILLAGVVFVGVLVVRQQARQKRDYQQEQATVPGYVDHVTLHGNRTVMQIHFFTTEGEEITCLGVSKPGETYEDGQTVFVTYPIHVPTNARLSAEDARPFRNAGLHLARSIAVYVASGYILLMLLLAWLTIVTRNGDRGSLELALVLLAVMVMLIGVFLMAPYWLYRKRFKKDGVQTQAVVEQVNAARGKVSLLLRYEDETGGEYRSLVELPQWEGRQPGETVDVIYWRKKPEKMQVKKKRQMLKKICFGLGIFCFTDGLILLILNMFVDLS